MTESASFIPPNVMPPDPPEAKAVAFVFASIMTIVLLAFIGFVCIEFVADMAGRPLNFGVKQESQDVGAEEFLLAVGLLTPAHQSHVPGPRVLTMYRQCPPSQTPPLLLVNGRLHLWEGQYGDDTWYVWLELEMGEHHIRVEACEALFFVIPSAMIDLWEPLTIQETTPAPPQEGNLEIVATQKEVFYTTNGEEMRFLSFVNLCALCVPRG